MEPPGGNDCDCRWSFNCAIIGMGTCEDGWNGCEETSTGCGFLYQYSCTGNCDGEIEPESGSGGN